MDWLWVIVIAVVLLIVMLKFKEVRHRLLLIVVVLIVLFFIASFGQLYSNHSMDLTTFEGITEAGKVYMNWLFNAGSNVVKLSGYAIKQDWGVNMTGLPKG